jgi:hypothetical protein
MALLPVGGDPPAADQPHASRAPVVTRLGFRYSAISAPKNRPVTHAAAGA